MSVVADFVVPPVGEPIDSARLVRWLATPGQAFHAGEVLVEIETDKSIVEVPAPQDGVMVEHLVDVDGLLNADTPIARIRIEEELAASARRPGLAPEALSVVTATEVSWLTDTSTKLRSVSNG